MEETLSHHQVRSYLRDNLDDYLALLEQWVEINSFTANRVGVEKLGRLTADHFAGLGFSADHVRSTNSMYGNHLVLSRPGSGPQSVGLVAHLDTVYPADEERRNNHHWRVEGERIYGPGTIDIKGGTLMIYMVLDAIRANFPDLFQAVNWLVLLNASEEALTADFGELCRARLPQDTRACLVFERGVYDNDCFNIVVARKGMATFRIQVKGRGAHAGSSHHLGANAVVQLAQTISRISQQTDYGRNLTFNVGTVAGGTVINRVPHLAVASGELRAFSPALLQQGVEFLLAQREQVSVLSASDQYPCDIDVEIMRQAAPWAPNEVTNSLFDVWQETADELGIHIQSEERGGLSDGNLIWDFVPTLDGLGPHGANDHCSERSADGRKDQEYVLVSTFVPKALLNVMAIRRLLG